MGSSHRRYITLKNRGVLSDERATSLDKFLEDVENTFEEGYRLARYNNTEPFSLENSYWLTPRVDSLTRGDVVPFTNSPSRKRHLHAHIH